MIRRPPKSTLFPYPPLFESEDAEAAADDRPLVARVGGGRPREGDARREVEGAVDQVLPLVAQARRERQVRDRKSTRLNSSHANISYAVFCLKKKNNISYTAL